MDYPGYHKKPMIRLSRINDKAVETSRLHFLGDDYTKAVFSDSSSWIWCFAALIGFGLPVFASLLTALFLWLVVSSSMYMLRVSGFLGHDPVVVNVGAVSIASGIIAILAPWVSGWIILIAVVVLALGWGWLSINGMVRNSVSESVEDIDSRPDSQLLEHAIMSFGASCFLVSYSPWMLLPAIVSLLVFLLRNLGGYSSIRLRVVSGLSAIYGSLLFAGLQIRQVMDLNPIPSSDAIWYGAQTLGIARHGLYNTASYDSSLNGHWLSIGFLGQVSEFIGVDGLIAMGVVGPVVASVLVSKIWLIFLRQHQMNTSVVVLGTAFLFLTNSIHKNQPIIDYEGLSNYIPMIWMISFPIIVSRRETIPDRRLFVVVSVYITFLTLGQAIFGVSVLAGWVLFWTIQKLSRSSGVRLGDWFLGVSLPTIAFMGIYLAFMSVEEHGTDHRILVGFIPKLLGENLLNDPGVWMRAIPFVLVLLAMKGQADVRNSFSFASALAILLGGTFFGFTSYGHERLIIGLTTFVVLMIVIDLDLFENSHSGRLFLPAIGGVLLGMYMAYENVRLSWINSPDRESLRDYGWALVLFIMIVAVLLIPFLLRRTIALKGRNSSLVPAVLVVFALSVNVGAGISQSMRTTIREITDRNLFQFYGPVVAVDELLAIKELGEWMNKNISRESIVATDRQCRDPLAVGGELSGCSTGFQPPIIGMFSGNQMYVGISFEYQLRLENIEGRLNRSIRFGENPSAETARQLLDEGVDYFVFDRRRGLMPEAIDGVNVLYENDFVRLVNLKDFVGLAK